MPLQAFKTSTRTESLQELLLLEPRNLVFARIQPRITCFSPSLGLRHGLLRQARTGGHRRGRLVAPPGGLPQQQHVILIDLRRRHELIESGPQSASEELGVASLLRALQRGKRCDIYVISRVKAGEKDGESKRFGLKSSPRHA